MQDPPLRLHDSNDAKLLLGIASASQKALIGEYLTFQHMYDRAAYIAETQRRNIENVNARMIAADEVTSNILDLIQDSGMLDGLEEHIRSLGVRRSLQLHVAELALATPHKSNVIYLQDWFCADHLMKVLPLEVRIGTRSEQ